MKVQFITSTSKYSQTPKGAFHKICRHCETEESAKIVMPHLMNKVSRYQKLSKTPKAPLRNCLGDKILEKIPVITPSMTYSKFHTRQMSSANLELFSACLIYCVIRPLHCALCLGNLHSTKVR